MRYRFLAWRKDKLIMTPRPSSSVNLGNLMLLELSGFNLVLHSFLPLWQEMDSALSPCLFLLFLIHSSDSSITFSGPKQHCKANNLYLCICAQCTIHGKFHWDDSRYYSENAFLLTYFALKTTSSLQHCCICWCRFLG